MPDGIGNPVQGCPGSDNPSPREEKKPELHWVKFKVQDDAGKPLKGVVLQIVLPDGSREEKTSDENGMIEINNVQPGDCKIDLEYDDHVVHSTYFIQ